MKKSIIALSILAIFACGESSNSEPEQLPVPTQKHEQVKSKPEVAPENKEEVVLAIEGMTCPSCQHTIQSDVLKMPGVVECKVSLTDKNAVVVFDKTVVSPDKIVSEIQSIEDGAYKATISEEEPKQDTTSNVSHTERNADEKQMFSQIPHFEIPNLFTFFLDFIR
tara:strand:+ start:73 stop:570 length:498 start_codon:yes stop_codon:yes gene_type:complete